MGAKGTAAIFHWPLARLGRESQHLWGGWGKKFLSSFSGKRKGSSQKPDGPRLQEEEINVSSYPLFFNLRKMSILNCGFFSGRNCHIKSDEIDGCPSVWRVG